MEVRSDGVGSISARERRETAYRRVGNGVTSTAGLCVNGLPWIQSNLWAGTLKIDNREFSFFFLGGGAGGGRGKVLGFDAQFANMP